jgi:hypothetical protein
MRAGTVEIVSGLIVGLILFAAAMAGAAALKRYSDGRVAKPAARTGSEVAE